MSKFQPTPQIFADETVLHPNTYEPDEFPAREKEEEEYIAALQPVINDAPPKHLFLKGKPGTGKTSMSKHLLQHLEEDCADHGIDVTSIYVNLNSGPRGISSYGAGVKIINKIRKTTPGNYEEHPTSGHSEPKVYKTLFKEINTIGGIVLLVLDEIHELTDDSILYQLPRAKSMEKLADDTHVGIIGISNDPQVLRDLSPDVKDTLTQETILFQPYNSTQLEDILAARAEKAFHDAALEDAVIPLCAALAAQCTGSAREALDLLRVAGELARREHETTVTTDHVRDAEKKLDRDATKNTLQGLTLQEQLSLLSLAYEVAGGNAPVPTSDIYSMYEKFCTLQNHKSLHDNRFADRLKSLEQQHLVARQLDATGGRQHVYHLNVDLPLLLEAFDPDPDYTKPVEKILGNALNHNNVDEADVEDLDAYERLTTTP
jgi:cell division control protein 6